MIYKKYCIQSLLSEVDVANNSDKTETVTTLSEEEILGNHKYVPSCFGLFTKDDNCDLQSMFWIPQIRKSQYNQRYIGASAKCTIKPLSKLLTSILIAVIDCFQSYHDTCYSNSDINSMCVLTNSTELLRTVNSRLTS